MVSFLSAAFWSVGLVSTLGLTVSGKDTGSSGTGDAPCTVLLESIFGSASGWLLDDGEVP